MAGAQQAAERAIQLLGAAESLRALIGVPLPARDQLRYQQVTAAARAQLEETTYTRIYAAGYAMSPNQVVTFALTQFAEPQHAAPQS